MRRSTVRTFLPVFHALQSAMAGRRDEFLRNFDAIPAATRRIDYPELVWLEGEALFHRGRLLQSKDTFEAFRVHADVRLCPAWMRDLARIRVALSLLRTGNLTACRDTLKEIEREVEPVKRTATLRADLAAIRAYCYEADGIFEKATANFQLSFEEAVDVGDPARQASAASNVGRLLAQMGYLRPAIMWQRRAGKILGTHPDSRLRRAITLRLARVERTIGHDRETWPQVEEILRAPDLDAMPSVMITALTEAHEHDVLHGRYDEGIEQIVVALGVAKDGGLALNRISLLRDLSRTYRDMNRRAHPDAEAQGRQELLQAIESALELPEVPMRVLLELGQDVLDVEGLCKSPNLTRTQREEFPKQVAALHEALQSRPHGQAKRMRERHEKAKIVQGVLAQLVRDSIRLATHTVRPSGDVVGNDGRERLKLELMDLLNTCLRVQRSQQEGQFTVDQLVGAVTGRDGRPLADVTVRDRFTELRALLKPDIHEARLPGPGNRRAFRVALQEEGTPS